MKIKKFFLYVLLFIFFSHSPIFSQETSDSVHKFLKKNHYSPITQNLVTPGTNAFPYNIILDFPATEPGTSGFPLLLIFNQDDVLNSPELIKNTLQVIKNCKVNFDISVVFLYGENQVIEKQGMIYGSTVFLDSINANKNYTAIIFDLSSSKNNIISNSNGNTAPSWLIKNEFDIYLHNKINQNLPVYYLSQMHRLNFYYDRILSEFYSAGIPAIKLNVNTKEVDNDTFLAIVNDSVDSHANIEEYFWDQHFLMIRSLTGYLILSEMATIRIILITIFIWLIFIFFLFLVNNHQKYHNWSKIKKIWYVVPVTFFIVLLSFYEGNLVLNFIPLKLSDAGKIYVYMSLKIFLSVINTTLFYILILIWNKDFEARSIDFLITLCCFINQSIFILSDISLFPIFMFICFLSILAILIKNNILHILIFILMIIPFIPYIHDVVESSNINSLKTYIFSEPKINLTFALIIYPVFIVFFRIVTFYRNKKWNKSSILISSGIFVVIILSTLFTVSFIRIKQINKNITRKNNIIIKNTREELIDFNYYDKQIFSDTIRTININLQRKPVQCNVTIIGDSHIPISYTDNDYEQLSQNTIYFKIPYCPPEKMSFNYGLYAESNTIKITAIFEDEKNNEFILATKTYQVGE